MRNTLILDLAECAELSNSLQARPPRLVRGTVWLMAGLLAAAVTWAALTKANLVVRAAGRMRPIHSTTRIVNSVRGESLSNSTGGRVVEVNFGEGDAVKKGDVLIRFDTKRLDNEIVKLKQSIRTGEEELADLRREEDDQTRLFAKARQKGEAEVEQARTELSQAGATQTTELEIAQAALSTARDDVARMERQMASTRGAVAEAEYVKAMDRVKDAQAKLQRAQLPVNKWKPEIQQLALSVAEMEQALKKKELAGRRRIKEAEIAKARLELVNLEQEHSQTVLLAPVDGVVTEGDVKVGDVIAPNQKVLEIAERQGFRFEILVPSEDVGHLRVGLPVTLKLDAYDFQKYGTLTGTVCYISPDSVAPSGQPAGDAAGARGPRSAVFAVKIDLDADEVVRGGLRGKVKLGMSGQAEIVTDNETLLILLLKQIRQSISLG